MNSNKQKRQIEQDWDEIFETITPKVESKLFEGDRDIHSLEIRQGRQKIEIPLFLEVEQNFDMGIN